MGTTTQIFSLCLYNIVTIAGHFPPNNIGLSNMPLFDRKLTIKDKEFNSVVLIHPFGLVQSGIGEKP